MNSGGSRPRVEYLDGWRGLSILAVLAGHFTHIPGTDFGPFGVEMFFVLSGRLMAQILFVEKIPLKLFYQRRISRIYPALLFFVVISVFVFGRSKSNPVTIFDAVYALTFTYNYATLFNHAFNIDHLWSLCVEEHAYFLLGIFALGSRRWNWPVQSVLWIVGLAAMLNGLISLHVLHHKWQHVYWRTDVRVASILIPAALYLATRSVQPRPWLAFVSPVCLAIGTALFMPIIPVGLQYTLGTCCLALAVCGLDFTLTGLKQVLSLKALTFMGVISFSVYLWQQPFYQASFGLTSVTRALLGVAATVVGLISYFAIETPARRRLNTWYMARQLRKSTLHPAS